jgi:hypothetical protein
VDQRENHFSKGLTTMHRTGPMHWIAFTLTAAIALSTASCAVSYTDVPYSPEQLQRRVVDARTGGGIADAIVVFLWDRNETDIGHASRTLCYRVDMTRTDAQGRYALPSWNERMPMIATIYKKGLVDDRDAIASSKGIDKMSKGSEDFATRLAELRPLLIRCGEDEDRKLLEFYRALLDEARSLAKTDAERRQADSSFLWYVDAAQYGRDAAFRRSNEK